MTSDENFSTWLAEYQQYIEYKLQRIRKMTPGSSMINYWKGKLDGITQVNNKIKELSEKL